MNYLKLAKVFTNVLQNYAKKRGMKEVLYEEVNDAADIPDFVQKYVFGIGNLNEHEIELDKKFYERMVKETEAAAEMIMKKDVNEWTEDDYQFIRSTQGYSSNLERRRKVLNYLNYNRK